MNGREEAAGVATRLRDVDGLVVVARRGEPTISGEAVGDDGQGLLGIGGEEARQALGRGVGDGSHAHAAEPAFAVGARLGLDCTRHHGLASSAIDRKQAIDPIPEGNGRRKRPEGASTR